MNESSNIVLLGDYNYNLLEKNSLPHTCYTYDLHNLVTSATCFKGVRVLSLTCVLYHNLYALKLLWILIAG